LHQRWLHDLLDIDITMDTYEAWPYESCNSFTCFCCAVHTHHTAASSLLHVTCLLFSSAGGQLLHCFDITVI
jgi:hypothetical protein